MWQYGIDQWIGCNKYIYGKTKEEQQEKENQEVDAQVRRMHQIKKTKCNGKTGTSLKCQLQRDWGKHWIERKGGLNVLTLHMKHGQKYRQHRI